MIVEVMTATPAEPNLTEMDDGNMAVILDWPDRPNMAGIVVQRYRDGLIILGKSSEMAFPDIFKANLTEVKIRKIRPDETLVTRE